MRVRANREVGIWLVDSEIAKERRRKTIAVVLARVDDDLSQTCRLGGAVYRRELRKIRACPDDVKELQSGNSVSQSVDPPITIDLESSPALVVRLFAAPISPRERRRLARNPPSSAFGSGRGRRQRAPRATVRAIV